MDRDLLSRMQACLLGVKIGDAMGMPWETMSPEQILEATDGIGVTGFHRPVQRGIRSTMGLEAGDSTDDWQLTAVLAESLIRCRGFNLTDIAIAHVEAFRKDSFGWGRTTRTAIGDIERYFDSRGKSGRAPWVPAPLQKQGSCGNGVAMKIAPLALWHAPSTRGAGSQIGLARFDLVQKEALELGLMTHADIMASISGLAIIDTIGRAISCGIRKESIDLGIASRMDRIGDDLKRTAYGADDRVTMSGQLKRIFDEGLLSDPVALRERIGTGCFALESVPFAIATFLRHPTDFRAGVLEAIDAGGDTDSTASMVGALIGANCGLDAIPDEWKNFRSEFQEPLELGERLYRAAAVP